MADDVQEIALAATRALKDPSFAQEILDGKQDYPEVRAAILADLADANQGESRQSGAQGLTLSGTRLVGLADRAKPW